MAMFRLYPSIKFNLQVAPQKISRSPFELRSDRRETLGKSVSDDLQLSIFDAKNVFRKNFRNFLVFFRDFRAILEELRIFGCQNQLLHQLLLQIHFS